MYVVSVYSVDEWLVVGKRGNELDAICLALNFGDNAKIEFIDVN